MHAVLGLGQAEGVHLGSTSSRMSTSLHSPAQGSPPTAVPRVAGLMGLDGSPEGGVQGPRVLLSGHQGGHRAPRMGRSSAPRAPSPHAEARDQQTPAQSGPAQRAQGHPTPTGRVLDDGPDLLLRPWASGPLTAPASPGQCTAARPSGRPSAGHEDCGSVNPG